MKLLRYLVLSLGVCIGLISVGGCNTVKGAGEDIKGAAEGTERVIQGK